MKKFALTAVLVLALMPSAEASTRLVTSPKCEEPVPTRAYHNQSMTYSVSIDLRGCSWWNGSPIRLVASLSRLDGTGESGTTTGTICGGWPAKQDDTGQDDAKRVDQDQAGDEDTVDDPDDADRGDKRDRDRKRKGAEEEATGDESDDSEGFEAASASADRFTCDVTTGLEHPSAEVALYRGEVTYPWKDGDKTVGFSAYCASPGGLCRDGR